MLCSELQMKACIVRNGTHYCLSSFNINLTPCNRIFQGITVAQLIKKSKLLCNHKVHYSVHKEAAINPYFVSREYNPHIILSRVND